MKANMYKQVVGLMALGFVALTACKGKSNGGGAATGSSAGSAAVASGSGSAAGSAAPTPAPAGNGPKLAAGPLKFGCIGWSASAKTAACITGATFSNEPTTA